MYFMKIALILCGGAGVAMVSASAVQAAPVSPLEVKIELRVLDFISDPSDRSVVAVLYDRDRAGSAEEAAAVLKALQDSAGLARYVIAPRLVDIRSLSALTGVKAAIMTSGLDEATVLRYGVANRTLVLSAGTACAKQHRCMVGVTTAPDIEIGVNMPAIEDAHIRFSDGFELMVKEY
jgi:hypothetical protein